MIDRSSISPLAYQALTQISVPNNTLNLNLPNLAQAAGVNPVNSSTVSSSLGTNQLFTITPKNPDTSIANLLAVGNKKNLIFLLKKVECV